MTVAAIDTRLLRAGFSAPVLDSQSSFRAILNALSFPGRIHTIPAPPEAPDGWSTALAAIALTMLDADSPVYLDSLARTPGAEAFVRFHAGAPIADAPGDGAFAVLLAPDSAPFDDFSLGEDQYPDRSATLVCAVSAFHGGQAMRLTGPGVETFIDIAPTGLGDGFWAAWARNSALYPLGYDVLLTCGAEVIGLPRSVAAERLEG